VSEARRGMLRRHLRTAAPTLPKVGYLTVSSLLINIQALMPRCSHNESSIYLPQGTELVALAPRSYRPPSLVIYVSLKPSILHLRCVVHMGYLGHSVLLNY